MCDVFYKNVSVHFTLFTHYNQSDKVAGNAKQDMSDRKRDFCFNFSQTDVMDYHTKHS